MSATLETIMDTADREMVLTRVFDAPRELVFRAWTTPAHLARWFGPRGFTTTTQDVDVRRGGVWRFVMHGPDGTDYPNLIRFDEIVAPERLVYSHGAREDDPGQFQVTISFETEGGKTRLTMRSLLPSAEALNTVKQFGAFELGHSTLDRLEELVAETAPAHAPAKVLVLTRFFKAPRELVFRAWTDPKHLARWWGPKEFTNPVCEVDLRPGGALYIVMRGPDGAEYPMRGTFHEVAPPERLVYVSSALEDADGRPQLEVLTTVTFAQVGDRTQLTMHADVTRATSAAAFALAGMEPGWTQSLDKLGEYLADETAAA